VIRIKKVTKYANKLTAIIGPVVSIVGRVGLRGGNRRAPALYQTITSISIHL
jgi:hypothetical protein